jgi:uncharacterized protein
MTDFASTKSLTGPVGALEVATALPAVTPTRLAIICHPHPLFGGTMHNKVVTTVERSLRELGAATVRFNFRGVGSSHGSFDDGMGESDDLAAIVAFARSCYPALPLDLAGFSFGSFVAARMANAAEAARLITIAPAVTKWDFSQLSPPSMPWLIVQGEADEVVDPQAVYRFAANVQPAPRLIRMAECSHFFHGKLLELREVLTAALQ